MTTARQRLSIGRRALLAFAFGASLQLAAGAAAADALRLPARAAPAGFGDAALCTGPLKGQVFQRTELFFGRNSPNGPVSEAQFEAFLDEVVTPLFPDGLTVIDAKGQFRTAPGQPPEKEDAKLLILLYPLSRDASASVEEIRARYKAQFAQQSVLRVDERSCVSF